MILPTNTCPRCGSKEVHFRQSRSDWVCDVCEHTWQPISATSATDRPRPRLFLSYGRRDARGLADRLRTDLEGRGYEVWQDTRQIRSGSEWEQEIQDALRNCRLLIALLSPHAVRTAGASDNPDDADSVCLDEISFARYSRPPKPVVPVMAITCEPPLSIYRLDYVDLRAWQESAEQYQLGLSRLVEAIEAGLRGEVHFRSWDHQLRPWDFSAFLAEKRVQFCGRDWLFAEIENWRKQSQERALLLVGDPGTGKSAIVAELVHRNPEGQVLAFHCCQADTKETLQPARFVRNLAAMIASKLEAYAERLSAPAVEEALSEANCARDPASAFEAGVLTPLESLPPPGGVRYLLVDALDESLALADAASRTTIVDVLAGRLERLPPWLRLVATTRRERAVLDRLRGVRVLQLDPHDPRNLDDVNLYIRQRLETPLLRERLQASGLSEDQAVRALADKADGNILYVLRALEGIERDVYSLRRLGELPPGLYGLYLGFFNRVFPDEASFAPARNVLEVLVAAGRPLRDDRLARATGLDRDTELPRVLRRLSAYLTEQRNRYTVYHKSFADWLTSPDQRGSLHHVSRRRGHERLADVFWAEFQQGPGALSNYAKTFLPTHLAEAGRWEKLAELLCDLRFVEAKCVARLTAELQADYDLALGAWPNQKRHDLFARTAPAPLPLWLREVTAAVIAATPVPHPDRAAGPVLSRLQAAPPVADVAPPVSIPPPPMEETRGAALAHMHAHPASATPPVAARFAPGAPMPAELFGPDDGAISSLAAMRQREGTRSSGDATIIDSPLPRLQAFATFFSTHSHRLAALPRETVLLARNHASSGPVVEAAERLLAGQTRPCVLRDPRPPALPARPACVRTLEGHTNRLNTVVFSPDGRTAVSTSSDGTLRVWDLATGSCVRTLEGHRRSVRGVALAADGVTAISSSHDCTLRVWNIRTGACLKTLRGHDNWVNAVALTPDGTLAVSAGAENTVRVWDLAGDGRCLRTLTGHTGEVRCVALTPDGRLAISGSADGTLRLWDVASGNCVGILRGHTDGINGVALTPDGRLAASASRDRTVLIWDVAAGQCLRVLGPLSNWINGVALTPDGRLALTAGFDLSLQVWDMTTGECVRQLPGHTAWISDVAVTPDGRLAISAGSDHTLRVWDLASGEVVRGLPGHSSWVCPVQLSGDGKLAVSPGRDRALRVWDTSSGRCLHVLEGHDNWVNAVALTPDGGRAVSCSSDHSLRTWDMTTGKGLRTVTGHGNWVQYVLVTPDGSAAVSSSSDKTVRVWDLASGVCLHTLEGHGEQVTHLAQSLDGRTLVSISHDHTVRVWDLPTGTCRHILSGHTDFVEAVAVTPDGRIAVSGSGDRTVRTWDLRTGSLRHTFEGHGDYIEGLALTPDGRLALSASRDGTVGIWDLAKGERARSLTGHALGVTGVSVSPDGQLAFSAGWDGTLRVWRIATGECIAIYHAGARVPSATVGPDGRIVCGTGDGQVHFLTLRHVTMSRPLVTAVRLCHVTVKEDRPHPVGKLLPFLADWLPGERRYDTSLSVRCPWCGKRSAPPTPVMGAIGEIGRSLTPEQAPCLALPPEAWADPRLVATCPHCSRDMQFNPFVVDCRDDR